MVSYTDMESYSKSEKADIFENVNTMYLHLSGIKKSETKRSFKTLWKEDNLSYKLMIALFGAYDKWQKLEQNDDHVWQMENLKEGHVSNKTHERYKSFLSQDINELKLELEKIKEGKGYISEQSHKEQMKEQLQEQKEIIREISSKLGSSNQRSSAYETKYDIKCKEMDAQKRYYEEQILKISNS
tara:strand:+ start:491 stop:1045 length:555 start_codon:yes stop_codon:yes gene_type:complete